MGISVFFAICFRFNEYILKRNFTVYSHIPCNQGEMCFFHDCDESTDPECDTAPYKKVTIDASIAPQCIYEHSCNTIECTDNTKCHISYCTPETVDEGEKCMVNIDN